jgi:MscS family membrane protein
MLECPSKPVSIRSATRYFFLEASVVIVIAAFLQIARAQVAMPTTATPAAVKPQDPYNRTSPASSVLGFLEACREKNYIAATRYLDLRRMTSEERRQQGPRLAEELAQALDNDPQFDLAALSHDPKGDDNDALGPNQEHVITMHPAGKTLDIQLEREEVRSGVFIWRFSPETVALIPTLTQTTAASRIERYLPGPLARNTFLDTPCWRWIALLISAIVVAAISGLFARITLALLRPALRRLSARIDWSSVEAFVGPLQLLVGAALFRAAIGAIDPSAIVRLFLGRALSLVSILAVTWLCMRVVDAAMAPLRAALGARRRTMTHSVVPLAGRIVKITVLAFGITAVLASWGYDTKTVLAGLGIGGIAIALAAKATVENFFGGLAVITDHPVFVGDFCKFGESVGTVEDIGLRSTRIRTLDRTLLTVPNAQFSSVTVENFSRQDKMLLHLTLNLRRDTNPDQLRAILTTVEKILENHSKIEPGRVPVRFIGVGTYSLDIEIFVYVLTEDGDEFMVLRQDLILRVLDAVSDAGTSLALPTQASILYPNAPESSTSPALAAVPQANHDGRQG